MAQKPDRSKGLSKSKDTKGASGRQKVIKSGLKKPVKPTRQNSFGAKGAEKKGKGNLLPISVSIIGYNEQDKVEECLKSVAGLASEIVFVDSLSTDKTIEIVKKYTKRIYKQKFLGHVQQKNFAIDKTSYDWVLSLDCDERLTREAADLIRSLWEQGASEEYTGFEFKRLNFYIYRFIRHSGWYPDRKIRLFNKKHARWEGENPHDRIVCREGRVKRLGVDILHYTTDSISQHLKTIDAFSTIAAREAFEKGRKSGPMTIIFRTLYTGFRKIFYEMAFLDGVAGLILTGISMAASWSKYSKLYILQKQKEDPEFLKKNRVRFK